MAMGHISVSRERGAPPKNQIECKNRINSSCRLESYVPVGSLLKLSLSLSLSLSVVFCLRPFSFSHTLYFKLGWSFSLSLPPSSSLIFFFFATRSTGSLAWLHLEKRPITSHIFSYSTCLTGWELCGCWAYERFALYRQVRWSPPTSVHWTWKLFYRGYRLSSWSTVYAWTLDINEVVGINKVIS